MGNPFSSNKQKQLPQLKLQPPHQVQRHVHIFKDTLNQNFQSIVSSRQSNINRSQPSSLRSSQLNYHSQQLEIYEERRKKQLQKQEHAKIQFLKKQQSRQILSKEIQVKNIYNNDVSKIRPNILVSFQQNLNVNQNLIHKVSSQCRLLINEKKIERRQTISQTVRLQKQKAKKLENMQQIQALKQNKREKCGTKYQSDESNHDVRRFILANNQLEKKYQPPKKSVRIKDIFANQQQYACIMKKLLQHEIIENVNQSLDKKLQSPNQSPTEGKIKQFRQIRKEERKFQSTSHKFQFIPISQQLKTKLKKILIRGSIVCIASINKQLKQDDIQEHTNNGQIICQLGIATFNQQQDSIIVDFLSQPRNSYTFLFDLDPIITYQRQMSAVLESSQFNHIFNIINPQLGQASQQSAVRQRISENMTMRQIKRDRNQSQVQTIQKMLITKNGIHLVQGPPGTGKTDTILNFLSLQLQCLQKQTARKIILVCSQSNAAIDDIATKIKKKGLINFKLHENHILRLGKMSLASKHLIGYNIRHRCQKQLLNTKTSVQIQIDIEEKQLQLKGVSRERDTNNFYNRLREIRGLEKKIIDINKTVQTRKREYDLIEQKYLQQAIIVLSTLSASGRNKIIQTYKEHVGCLIIDQACQTTEPSILIPFQYQPDKAILVGDPKQLEPTVISNNKSSKYHRSMFQRFIDVGKKPHFLNTQYRMVPQISSYPNRKFYGGRLQNGRTSTKPNSFSLLNQKFRENSILFVDVAFGKESKKNKSYLNKKQAEIISFITRRFVKLDPNLTIGVITPYSSQTIETENKLMQEIPVAEERKNIKVSTVDAFQGQEKDVIIMTCVRADGRVGFLNNQRRLNVALTRAKNALIVVGNEKTLFKDSLWKDYITWMKNKNAFESFSQQKACKKYIGSLFIQQTTNKNNYTKLTRMKSTNEIYYDDF